MKPRDNITRKLIAKEQGITEMAVRRAVEFGRGLEAANEVGGQNDHQPKVRKKSVPNASGINQHAKNLVGDGIRHQLK